MQRLDEMRLMLKYTNVLDFHMRAGLIISMTIILPVDLIPNMRTTTTKNVLEVWED